jgi:glutaredoxin-like protein
MSQEFPVVTEARVSAPVTVYWRPGCPYCRRLRQDLRRIGLPAREINIWEDRSAAETVRSVADGNETVPTVVVGDRAMVNPPASAVVEEVRRQSPGFAAETGITRVAQRLRMLRVIQWTVIIALVATSFAVEAVWHSALSWVLDIAAVGVYVLFRLLR